MSTRPVMGTTETAAASSLVAGGIEGGDRGGGVCAGLVGLNGCPALRRCEPGIQLAEALSCRSGCGDPLVGSATGPRCGHGGAGCRYHAAIACCGGDRDRSCRLSIVSALATASMRRHSDVCSMCGSGDDPGSLGRVGVACGRRNEYARGVNLLAA